jgi:hypothetical protein
MSKKLIAVASATALALSALVGIAPAVASGPSIAFSGTSGAGGDGSTSALAATDAMPTTNIMSTGFSAVLAITGLATGDVVRVETSGGNRMLEDVANFAANANANLDVSKLGSQLITKTRTSDATLNLNVFSTSTTAAEIKVSVTRPGLSYSSSIWFKGAKAEDEYNIVDVTGVPATLAKGAKADITFKGTDVFGNQVEDDTELKAKARVTVDGSPIAVDPTWDAAAKVYKASITSPSSSAFIVKIDAGSSIDIDGYADAVSQTFVVNNTGVAAQVATLTTQLAEANAKLANRVTKKRFNTLARKWNAAFPSQKVKLKK